METFDSRWQEIDLTGIRQEITFQVEDFKEMAIYGLTHTDDGKTIQRLSVSTKLAVGLPPGDGRKGPTKLDHFIFLKKIADSGTDSDWVIDQDLTEHYGKQPREVEIILLSDDIEEIFPTMYAWFTRSKRVCSGDGHDAVRRTEANPGGEPWSPCGRECPDLKEGRCKPSGDLRFTLADFPQLGAVARIHTSSYRSIMQINSALHQVQLITGGRLCGIRGSLVVRQEKASYRDKDGTTRSTKIPALSVEIRASGMTKLIEGMVGTARAFEQTRRLLGSGHIQVIEGEETSREMAEEFYTDHGEEPETKVQERHTRKERERGTLEPSREPNRGHGNEGFHEADKTAQNGSKAKVQTIDAKDASPGKAEPDEKASKGKKKAEPPNQVTVTIVRVEPKMTRLKPKQIEENAVLTSAKKEPKHEGQPFYRLHCADAPVLYVYDKHLFRAITPATQKSCVFSVTEVSQGYLTVVDIESIGGVRYVRDPETKDAVPAEMVKLTELPPHQTAKIHGDVIETSGPQKPKSGSEFVSIVILDLPDDRHADLHAHFACIKPELFDLVLSCKGRNAEFLYSKSRQGKDGIVWQMIEDVTRIDDKFYKNGKEENPDAEPIEGELFP